VAPLVALIVARVSVLGAVAIVFASHMLVLYPTLRPLNQWWGPVFRRFRTDQKEVWLTIDDGPTRDTPAILDLLERYNARATFFLKGALAECRPDLVSAIRTRGHTIANHTQTHPSAWFWALGPKRIAREIDDCDRAIRGDAAVPELFRAPVGMKNFFVHPLLSRRGKLLIGWSARAFDGIAFDVDQAVERIREDLCPGAILLLHEGVEGDAGRRLNVELLERVLVMLAEGGYGTVIPTIDVLETGAQR
jgi:peptidoglycan-N-acetylglucosamine deacetylase